MAYQGENDIFNNPSEFERFFKEKYRTFCLLACRYVKEIETSEEVVQDVFVRIWERRDQIIVKGTLAAYIATSIKNQCLNYLKHQSIVEHFEKTEVLKNTIDPTETEEEMGDFELETAIINAIAELPTQRQKIFRLSRVDGLKYYEIAERLGLSVKTVEAQMGKALKQLRIKLKDYMVIFIYVAFSLFEFFPK